MRVLHWRRGDLDVADGDGEAARLRRGQDELLEQQHDRRTRHGVGDVGTFHRRHLVALLVGGIGVMAIMTISVKERTREIGTRKALGARRREILWQFLLEAVFLTGIGGLLGIMFGSGIGFGVHFATGFPISMPWWSFALGIGFSAAVGIIFGIMPAIRASALDPIDALRYE